MPVHMLTEWEYLLATDMDGTVLPPERTRQRLQEVADFSAAMAGGPEIALGYVTGRHLALARDGIDAVGLPEPDLLACDVGTSVYRRSDAGFHLDPEYRARVLERLGNKDAISIRASLAGIPGLELQESEKQAEFKFSYYFPAGPRGDAVVEEVRRRLTSGRDGPRVTVVSSREVGSDRGLLDILPAGVAKDFAVRYLHRLTDVEEDRVVVAGDSGNDRAVLLSGYRAIVVANAPDALKEDLRRAAEAGGLDDLLYFARQPFAAGVLEGCRHFGLL